MVSSIDPRSVGISRTRETISLNHPNTEKIDERSPTISRNSTDRICNSTNTKFFGMEWINKTAQRPKTPPDTRPIKLKSFLPMLKPAGYLMAGRLFTTHNGTVSKQSGSMHNYNIGQLISQAEA